VATLPYSWARRGSHLLTAALVFLFCAIGAQANEVASADLKIVGLSLEVDTKPVATGVDIPAVVQTIFGGKTNDDAPVAEGLNALGDLTGPGIDTPITLATKPGHQFVLPALHEKGEYTLQNIRLVGADGQFLQQAIPSFAAITVTDTLTSEVKVTQLTPDQLRERGITVDSRNFDVYEYTFIFAVEGKSVEIPYPVIVDRRTHETITPPAPKDYPLPNLKVAPPPRFTPPTTVPLALFEDTSGDGAPPSNTPDIDSNRQRRKPTIPAAIVIPTGFGVLHQFFAVILQVSNGAPAGSSIVLDSVTASIDAPLTLRVAKTTPAVSIGQPLPIYDKSTGAAYLVAAASGSGEWDVEALKAGTHTVTINVRATYKNPGQPDLNLKGSVSSSIVVSDPRFHVTFSHPDTIRKDEPYTAYAFITNLTAQSQTIHLDTRDILACGSGYTSGVCRTEGSGMTDLTLAPGQMSSVPYKLKSQLDGHIYAAAGSADDEAVGVDVKLTMGVSASGIPLSPATLLMPYYARYLDPTFIDANMQLLGLGYSLATAPLNAATAKFPRVVKGDVFERAQEITRAGQRVFITRKDASANDATENRDSFFNLSLDLLDNVERIDTLSIAPELAEWDQLRRSEDSGRRAAAAMARQLETNGLAGGKTVKQFVDDFATATNHRSPFALALVHGTPVSGATRPYALTVTGSSTHVMDIPAEAASGWHRDLPYGELMQFNSSTESGELALVGRWKENLTFSVAPQSDHFTLDLIYPDANDGAFFRASIDINGARIGYPVTFAVNRGSNDVVVTGATATRTIAPVAVTPLRVVAAAQDLHLDDPGHIVSLLFNRPIVVADAVNFRDKFSLTTSVTSVGYSITRKNTSTSTFIPGASLQDDGRIVNVSFDKALSTNAQYAIGIDPIPDAVASANVMPQSSVVPRVDNNRPGGLVYGKVLAADNSELPNIQVQLLSDSFQYDTTLSPHGEFLFEYIARDIDKGIQGNYTLSASLADGKYTEVKGTVRLPGQVQIVNLVFLGRGTAQGTVSYSDGAIFANANVVVTSPVFHEFKSATTDASGHYSISDLPVGPLTFLVSDDAGRTTYATNAISTPGQVITQNLVIQKKDFPGTGTVRVTVRRSDFPQDDPRGLVPNAHVGVYTQGYGLTDGYTDANGKFEFTKIPAGFISILAAEFNITRESAGVDMDLKPDTTIDTVLTLHVPTAADQVNLVTIQGTITRDDPTSPSDSTKDRPVAGAVLNISGLEGVVADASGNYVFPNVPISYSAKAKLSVFDPTTGRRGSFVLPTLVAGTNQFSPKLQSALPQGICTFRVRVFGPHGEPASGMRVISPGYPPTEFTATTPGVYEFQNVPVPLFWEIYAIPSSDAAKAAYGDELGHGTVRVDFDGQIGVLDLHLAGQGTILTTIEIPVPCGNPPCYSRAFGRVDAVYPVWDEAEQGPTALDHLIDMNQETNVATIKVPANVGVMVETVDHPAGYASANASVGFEGDVRNVTLRLSSLGDVTGRVFMFDGQTPVAGASVRFFGSAANLLPVTTAPDGSFKFAGVAGNQSFRIQAEVTQDGIYRIGYVDGHTPSGGGPVSNLVLVMREQSSIEGAIKDASGTAVPLAKYWVRELWWPYRSFGSQTDPLFADKNGHFIVGNLFTGPFRISAVSPDVQEVRGDYQGQINFESDNSQRNITVTVTGLGGGVGSITVVVQNPQDNFARVANAEVSLIRNGSGFDFGTTDANGVVTFDQIPISGTYSVGAYSKALGRAGSSATFGVALNQTTNVSVMLEFRGTVTGTLSDPESEPVANAPVKGSPVTLRTGAITTRASTDGTGAFEFLGIPEGNFSLEAFDLDSGRRAFSPPGLFISKLFQESHVDLQLERTATLHVAAYLPNDTGGAGVLAPLVNVKVTQTNYSRELQGNNLDFKKMFSGQGYHVVVTELGGLNRVIETGGSFNGALTGSVSVTFATSGSVQVTVLDSQNLPVPNASVTISGGNRSATLFTGLTGVVSLDGFPLNVDIAAQAVKDNKAASAGGRITSASTPLSLTLNLGATTSIFGFVDAEDGVGLPSVGTRVLATVSSRLLTSTVHLETRTDANGRYQFNAIPVGSTVVSLGMIGPDDVTTGAVINGYNIADGTTTAVELPRVKLDATPPRVVNLDPANNANNVSPNSDVVVTFSEQIAPQYLNTDWFQLTSTDDNVRVNATLSPTLGADGTYIVHIIPPDPTAAQIAAGQKYRLKSNVVYRVVIPAGITDAGGRNGMKNTVGTSFTTVNYTEPSIVRVDPSVDTPLPQQTTLRVKFNKAIDVTSYNAGNGGVLKLEQLDAYKGNPIATVPVTDYIDPQDPTTLVVAPTGVGIVESSFYRLTVAKTRDTQNPPNIQSVDRTFDWFSFDTKKPVPTIESPVPSGFPLISGIAYTATATVYDENTTNKSTDIAYVDWFDASGTFLVRTKTAPYSYNFVAPPVNTDGSQTTFTLKATATDLSGNTTASLQSFTWNVNPNNPPTDLTVTSTPDAIYPGKSTTTKVTFNDEGLQVTVGLEVNAKNTDDSDYHAVIPSVKITRAKVSDAWGAANFTVSIPTSVKDGTATLTATATDSAAKFSTQSASLTVLPDNTAPQIVSLTPVAETHFKYRDNYTIALKAKDAESGIQKVVFTYDGKTATATSGSTDANGVTTFTTSVSVPPKNADTRIHIVATAYDFRNNANSASTDVIYDSVNDAEIPKASWITPLDGAALPNNQSNWTTTLRVRATDNVKVTQVKFDSTALASPIIVTTPKSGTTDIFEAAATLNMPADLSSFVITATISDDDPAHDVDLPINIDPVHPDSEITADFSINATNVQTFANKSVMVRAGKKLFITVPVTLKNLMVLDGARVANPDQTKIDVTISDRLFVDADSAIDVTGKGYLGGWVTRDDNTSRNNSNIGMTLGATTTGGALESASYGGVGGESANGPSNATYGSITNPSDLGSGGGGSTDGHQTPGGSGGGAALIHGGTGASDLARFVVAGAIRADGGTGVGVWASGSGGSVLLTPHTLVTSADTRISANGGDEDAVNNSANGGGGGRVAISVSDRFDYIDLNTLITARGGRNGSSNEGRTYTDGGAGTIYIKKPGATNGDLVVSSYDSRYPTSSHLTKATPLGGSLNFDNVSVGPRTLARLDSAFNVTPVVDATALLLQPTDVPSITIASTTPADGGSVIQNTPISATFNAASIDGVDHVRAILAASSNDAIAAFGDHPATLTASNLSTTVPSTAAAGSTTLKLRVVSRSGRSVETPLTNFTIVANTAPTITQFDTTPAAGQIFPGHTINVSAAATDDVAVTSLGLTSTLGTVSSGTPVVTGNSRSQSFSVALSNTAAAGDITLTLSAADGFPGRANTTQTKTVTVLADTTPPSIAITSPTANQQIQEVANGTFALEATIVDNEVAVKSASATWLGTSYTLNPIAGKTNVWGATLPIPDVDGVDPVAKTISVTATDFANNATPAVTQTVFIKPLIDPAAPTVAWVCASPNAMFPAGYAAKLRISAIGASQTNGVSRVEFSIDGGAAITATSLGSNLYETTYTIPAADPANTVHNIIATATSTGGNKATLTTNITVIAGTNIATAVSIDSTNFTQENTTLIVTNGGTLTITGAHTFKNLAVLDGGKVIELQTSATKADAIAIDALYVSCSGVIDASNVQPRYVTYPGAAMADDSGGGGHIGDGSVWGWLAGSSFGSVYRPQEAGGGGAVGDPNYGNGGAGGQIRLSGSRITIDGALRANGFDNTTWGSGAGGSVWISANSLAGNGVVEARGGGDGNNRSGGGGGAIAIEYASASGTLINNCNARGGATNFSHPGAAGSIYLKGPSSTYGDLIIDNKSQPRWIPTNLPYFGTAHASTVTNGKTVLTDRLYVPNWTAGHYVRVFAPDGSVRGTWRIASVANHPSFRAPGGYGEVLTQDSVAYDGYVMWVASALTVGGTAHNYVAVRYNSGQWQYDNDSAFVNFTPGPNDFIFASFSKNTTAITDINRYDCTNGCAAINGVTVLGEITGRVLGNFRANLSNLTRSPVVDDAEMFFMPSFAEYNLVFGAGAATITLEDGTTAVDVRSGDTLRGVYLFDNVKVASGIVQSRDLLISTNTPSVDATSTLRPVDSGAPVIDASKITFTRGLNGAMLTGAAGAVADTDTPVSVVARDTARAVPPVFIPQKVAGITFGTNGGFSITKITTGQGWGSAGVSSVQSITDTGYLQFRATYTNKQFMIGLAPNDTTWNYAEASMNSFNIREVGLWEVWPNGAYNGITGSYTANTLFRIEKTPTTIRWFVDGKKVYETTANVPPSVRFDLAMNQDGGEVNSIEYNTKGLLTSATTANVNGDGSFSLVVDAAPGDAINVSANDTQTNLMKSDEVSVGAVPNDIGVASVTFPGDVIGGRSTTGTVTLLAQAGAQGAFVTLTGNNAVATLPASITIPANTSSATFTVTTTPITGNTIPVTVTATYANVTQTTILNVVKDNVPPSITITSPAANASYVEGSATKIPVVANVTDADSGVARVYATIDGVNTDLVKDTTKGANAYSGNVNAPYIDGNVTVVKPLTVSALDNSNNTGTSAPVNLNITPIVDNNPPSILWTCTSGGAVYPVGYSAHLRVVATGPSPANVIQSVVITVTDPSGTPTPYTATAVSGVADNYEVTFVVPNVADGSLYNINAVATAASGSQASITSSLTVAANVTAITTNTTIADTDHALDGKSIAVYSTTATPVELTIYGTHSYARLLVLSNGRVSHPQGVASFDVTTTDAIYVACDGTIDATGRGYPGNISYPGELPSSRGSGGTHIGKGGFDNGASPTGFNGSAFGSVKHPSELGGGGGYWSGFTGGGRVRLTAKSVVVDGSIRANGDDSVNGGGAAGGSVWITTQKIAGNGIIEARGSNPGYTPGGGGAIAVEYTDATSSGSVLTSFNTKTSNNGRYGGAGSIFIKGPGSTNGALTIDNGTLGATGTTELPSMRVRTVTSLTATGGARLSGEHWVAPFFVGHEVEVIGANGVSKGIARISAIDDGWYRFINASEWYLADGTNESGYLIWSENTTSSRGIGNGPGDSHWFPAKFVNGAWRYEDNGGFNAVFTPQATDRIFASFNANPWSFTPIVCDGTGVCPAAVNGIQTAEAIRGSYEPDDVVDGSNGGEMAVRGILIKDGLAPEVKFESTTGTAIDIAVGDTIKPLYRFDSLSTPHGETVVSFDELRINGITTLLGSTVAGQFLEYTAPITGTNVVVNGNVSATSITATNLTVSAGATLAHPSWYYSPDVASLTLNISGAITVAGTIDVSGRGYTGNLGYPNETASSRGSGGSHIGRGGFDNGASPTGIVGTAKGSVKQPFELGDGGGYWPGFQGGGRVKITSGSLQVDGSVRANGQDAQNGGGAAGGSIWITTGKITGNGVIEARGSNPGYTPGGGGAISVTYTDSSSSGSVLTTMNTKTGNNGRYGGAGSVFIKGPSATFGSLTVDNGALGSTGTSELPSLGQRTVTAITPSGGLRLSGERYVAPFFVGHEVEVFGANGVSKGIARVTSIDNGWYRFITASEWYLADGTNESGYLIWSENRTDSRGIGNGPGDNHWFPAKFVNGAWRYEDNGGFNAVFTPQATDRIFASFNANPWSFAPITCDANGVCPAAINGIQTAEALRGSYEPDVVVDGSNGGEMAIRSVLLKDGIAPEVKFESTTGTAITFAVGDTLKPLYRFDSVSTPHGETLVSKDELRVNGITSLIGPTAAGQFVEYTQPVTGTNVLVTGNISVPSITANGLTVAAGAVLTHPAWTCCIPEPSLLININGPVTVTGSIDVSGRGYTGNMGYPGEYSSSRGSGGSHIGIGGFDSGASPTGAPGDAKGNVKHPFELGDGGGYYSGFAGGGRLRLTSTSLQVDGSIRANGQDAQNGGGAAGGSIWVTTGKITGNGIIEARGSNPGYTPGGGGAIAVEYTDASSSGTVLTTMSTKTSTNGRNAGAGSVFIKGPTSTYGSVTLDNGSTTGASAAFPGIGNRSITSINANGSVKLTGEHWIAPYFVGNEVEITAADGTPKGIATISNIDNGWYRNLYVNEWYLADGTNESGYFILSDVTTGARGIGNGPGGNIFFPAKFVNGAWRYEDNGGFNATFTPLPSDRIFASFTANPWSITPIVCDNGVCPAAINGIQTAELLRYGFEPDTVTDSGNGGELTMRNVLIKDGIAADVTLQPIAGSSFTLAAGDIVRGIYRFDGIKLRNTKLLTVDKLTSTTTVDADAGSQLIVNNAPPVFPQSQIASIRVVSNGNGDVVTGPAGAVFDADTPIKLTARNTRTSTTFTANASTDGSFTIPVDGLAGDTFTLFATDSNQAPLSSNTINVNGAITEVNGVASLSVDPSTVTAGTAATVTIRLLVPARSTGVTVSLTSSDPSTFALPASITIPAGNSSTQFSVTAASPAVTTNVNVTASAGIASKTTIVNVVPSGNRLASLTLSSSTIQGGTSLNGTVTLGANAPAGGAVVMLASANTNIAGVPVSVIVPEGSNTATFTVTTSAVNATANTSISATWGASLIAPLSVTSCSTMSDPATPSIPSGDNVWIEDAAPSGSTANGSVASVAFVTTRAASGTSSLNFGAATGVRNWTMTTSTTFNVGASDQLIDYMLVNPCNPPREVLFIWSDGASEYRYSYGEELIDNTIAHKRLGPMPAGGTWTRQSVLASFLGAASKSMRSLIIKVYDGELWLDHIGTASCTLTPNIAPPAFNPNEVVWFDDALPTGATIGAIDSWTKTWTWDTTQAASGTQSSVGVVATGAHQYYFMNATDRMVVRQGDILYTYVLLDPCNPPREVLLQWNDGSGWEHRAYWGDDLIGSTFVGPRVRIGPLPEAGKWVRLELPASMIGLEGLNVSGVAFGLYDGRAWFDRVGRIARVNLALNKTATQSSTLNNDTTNLGAQRAVDGVTNGNYTQVNGTHTNSDANAWWQVDLGSVQPIENVVLWNRTDCCPERLSNFYVFVSDDPFTSTNLASTIAQSGVSSYYVYNTAPSETVFAINRSGRYVRVQLAGTNYLSLAEVQVWAPASATQANVAGGRHVSQVSTWTTPHPFPPELGVNGITNSNAIGDYFLTANTAANDWWELDLGSVQPISSIDLWNRMDCNCADRTTNFYVFVSDVPFTAKDVATTLAQSGVGVYYYGTPAMAGYTFNINRTGRYVRVQLAGQNYLQLQEVQVWSQLTALRAVAASPQKQ